MKPDLPVHAVLPELRRVLASAQRVVLSAPPGSGKTTLVPLELLNEPWLERKRILMLEPRRLAARASAARMAHLLGEPVGETVGYQVRFDRCLSAATRIEVVTEGILTRRLQHDPELAGVGLVIFDEFHERSLHGDLALALTLDAAESLRDDLRLLVMSATLDTGAVTALLGDATLVTGEGRSYPVVIDYLCVEPKGRIAETAAAGVLRALASDAGDVLLFVPGTGEIRASLEQLHDRLDDPDILLCPLYGELSREEQDRAILPDPGGRRRVVLATSIAETSITIEGVSTVVDSGWARRPSFDPNSGLTRLETLRASRAAVDQRAGRAGRLGPGNCHRLWTESTHSSLAPHTSPEIVEADLAPLALDLAQWGVADPAQLRWMTPPPVGAYAQARELLEGLDALDGGGKITRDGRRMAEMGLHPRLARMLLQAGARGEGALAADLAALLSERDPMRRRTGAINSVDLEERLRLLTLYRERGAGAAREAGADPSACRRIERAARQWRKQMGKKEEGNASPLSIGGLLASAYPDRIAQRRGADNHAYRLSSGRGVRLPGGDPLGGSDYLVAAQLDAGRREGRIFLAAELDLAELREIRQSQIASHQVVAWDEGSQSVSVWEEERLGALVLERCRPKSVNPDRVRAAMLEGVRHMGIQSLPWTDSARSLRERLLFLSHWQPEAGWPDWSDDALMASLEEWLAPWLDGISRKEHLERLDIAAILPGPLEWQRRQSLEELAPTHILVPSGSKRRLEYEPGGPPVLAVRLQEMFGLQETPRVCAGKVAVKLHLLSPAQRPIQVTQDLRGFWERTYREVKKELKGRYPKHYWPDDPVSAEATRFTRSRKS